MSGESRWFHIGLGIDVVASVLLTVSLWLAIPMLIAGTALFLYGLSPDRCIRVYESTRGYLKFLPRLPIRPERHNDNSVWPPISNREERDLFDELSRVDKHAVYIACPGYEGQQLADSLHNVLNRVGWPVTRGSGGFDAEGTDGIVLTTCDDPAPSLKRAIERTTSLNVTMMPITRGQAGYREYETMLVIGAKTWRAGRVDP